MSEDKKRILFLCTGNSCRSHMAEAWLRSMADDRSVSLSAGSKPAGYVHPLAVHVMEEAGVDISEQESKSIEEFLDEPPHLVISVCDNAARECPTFSGKVDRLHWPFDDPAHAEGNDDEKLVVFRRVRDEIRARLADELENILGPSTK